MPTRLAIHLDARASARCFIPLLFAIGIAIVVVGTSTIARADDRDDEAASTPWGPIVAGCLGVLFGAGVAAWQIRGRSRADERSR